MSLSIIQTPSQVSLAQSPIVFSVSESVTATVLEPNFQYTCNLAIWTGSVYNSGSALTYGLVKYPNTSLVGIFEMSNMINSTLRDYAQANTSNVKYFNCTFNWQWNDRSGSGWNYGTNLTSSVYSALDGYGIFPEPIGQSIILKSPYWPIMTDGPATQSVFIGNYGSGSIYVNSTEGVQPTGLYYSSSVGTGYYFVSQSANTTGSVAHFPQYPSQIGFPITTTGLTNYTITPVSGSSPIRPGIKYEVNCIQKYPNVRIKWKNRYGQFDFFNFYMVNKRSFNTMHKTYQPQLGSWQANTLAYNGYDTANLNYIVDSKQAVHVNTFWISEDYNDIFKELLVSDEIYEVVDESGDTVRPITIATSTVEFKTGVVDKVIQYAFDFNYGQPYKLIL